MFVVFVILIGIIIIVVRDKDIRWYGTIDCIILNWYNISVILRLNICLRVKSIKKQWKIRRWRSKYK